MYELVFDVKEKEKISKRKNLLAELSSLDEEEAPLPSEIYMKNKEEKKKEKEKEEPKKIDIISESIYDTNTEFMDDDWVATLSNFKTPKTYKKAKHSFDFTIDLKKKGKAKDKKKKTNIVNYKKEFEPEMTLLRGLQKEQDEFVDSLQKKYNYMESTKSTSRGVGKFTTDLIQSITSARSLSMQLVDKIISTKKTIADLDFKERKEFGAQAAGEQTNLANYAANYLKQTMNMGRNNFVGDDSYENFNDQDYNSDDLFDNIESSLADSDYKRSEESELYLKYEKENVSIKVIWNMSYNGDDLDQQYYFLAVNENGDVIHDYPLPEKTKLNINLTTKKATDKYGNKYDMILDG